MHAWCIPTSTTQFFLVQYFFESNSLALVFDRGVHKAINPVLNEHVISTLFLVCTPTQVLSFRMLHLQLQFHLWPKWKDSVFYGCLTWEETARILISFYGLMVKSVMHEDGWRRHGSTHTYSAFIRRVIYDRNIQMWKLSIIYAHNIIAMKKTRISVPTRISSFY